MFRPNQRFVSLVILLLMSALLESCGGGGGSANPPPQPPVTSGVPGPPASIIATAVSDTQIDLGWSSISEATSYSVYRSQQTGTPYATTIISNTTATMVSDATVTAGSTYYYVVTATNTYGEGGYSAEASATAAMPSGTLTIQGAIKYEDKEYDQYVGQNGNTSFKAVRFADVELVNASNSSVLWSTTTDSSGLYSINTSTLAGTSLYVRVLSTATPVGGGNAVSVKNLSPALYSVKTANFTLGGNANVNLSIPTSIAADGAFNILDVYVSGYEFIHSNTASTIPALNAFWQPNNSHGTYYCNSGPDPYDCIQGPGIYIYNNSSYDTDEFDDDVLWHEFGHFAADAFSKDDSQGGTHYLDDNTEDMRLSWSEGWGSYFQTAVKYWLDNTTPSLLSIDTSQTPLGQYVDTVTGGLYLTVNIQAPETDACISDYCMYSTNEISNAKVLWNIMDDTLISNGMNKIWDVFENYLPGVGSHSVNIEDLWDGLLASYPADSAEFSVAFSERLIDYSSDSYEADDAYTSAQTFTVGGGQSHRIYGDGDMDYVVFTVPTTTAQYTIRTSSLQNGADTFLTLFNNTGTVPIASNDYAVPPADPTVNDTTNLSSRIIQTLGPGTYYVSVKSNPGRPQSAGRYGSYTLSISTP